MTQPSALQWPADEIEARLHPTEAQRTGLTALQKASAKAADVLATSCRIDEAATPPARLAAVGKRLESCWSRSNSCARRSMISMRR